MLSFTELDADFDDENLNIGKAVDIDAFDSPTEIARPAKRKGRTQQRAKKPMNLMEEEEIEEEEEIIGEEIPDADRYGGDYGGNFGFPDESFGHDEEEEDLPLEEDDNLEDMGEEQVEEQVEEEEEEDIYGRQETPPPIKRGKGRGRGRPKASEKPAKTPTGKPRTKSSSSQPVAKRARTTSAAPHSPKIIQRKVIPHPADLSTMDGDGILPRNLINYSSAFNTNTSGTTGTLER